MKLCVLSREVAWRALEKSETSAVANGIINFVVALSKSKKNFLNRFFKVENWLYPLISFSLET